MAVSHPSNRLTAERVVALPTLERIALYVGDGECIVLVSLHSLSWDKSSVVSLYDYQLNHIKDIHGHKGPILNASMHIMIVTRSIFSLCNNVQFQFTLSQREYSPQHQLIDRLGELHMVFLFYQENTLKDITIHRDTIHISYTTYHIIWYYHPCWTYHKSLSVFWECFTSKGCILGHFLPSAATVDHERADVCAGLGGPWLHPLHRRHQWQVGSFEYHYYLVFADGNGRTLHQLSPFRRTVTRVQTFWR